MSGILFLMLFTVGNCWAVLSLRPGIYFRFEATDNLYLSEIDMTEEMIVTIAPNFWLEQRGKLLNLEVEYAYEVYRFLNDPSLNERIDTHFGRLDGVVLPERDFNVELHGDARLESLDTRRSDVIDSPTVNATNRYVGLIRPNYRISLGSRHSAEAAYAYETVQYDNTTSDDTQSHRVELSVARRQSSHLDFRVEGFYEQLSATINLDYDRLQVVGGGEWRPSTSLTLAALWGVSKFEYSTGETFDSEVYDFMLRYVPVQRWALDASYIKNFAYNNQDGLYRTIQGAGGLSSTGRLSWRLGLIVRSDDYVQVNREDQEQGFVGVITYQVAQKVLVGLNGDGRHLEFEPVSEKVNRYNVGASFEYSAREYVAVACRYLYRNNDSNIDVNDYIENRVSCDIQFTYNMSP